MTKSEAELLVLPEHIIKDLAVIGCSLRTDGESLFVSGLTSAEQNDSIRISLGMRAIIMDTLKANKSSLIEYLRGGNA